MERPLQPTITRFTMQRYYIKNEILKLPVKKAWQDETYEERVARVTIEMYAIFRRLKRRAKRFARRELQTVIKQEGKQ